MAGDREAPGMSLMAAVALALSASLVGGCEPREPAPAGGMIVLSGEGGPRSPATSDPVASPPGRTPPWPFWPTRMRVHPTTRIAADSETGRPAVEARVEFRDADQVVTRASGVIRLDLHDSRAVGAGREIGSWELDLRDPAINRARFDDVTRTYLFRLRLDQVPMPEATTLKVYFLAADGATLSAEQELRVQSPGP